MSWVLSTLESQGFTLRYGLYKKKESSKIKHYLFYLPGRGEYIEKYRDFPKKLELNEDMALVIVEYRGQGFSSGHPYHIPSYGEFAGDVQELISKLIKKNETYSFLCFSMGGLIALYGVTKKFFAPKSMFLVCPLLGLPKTLLWNLGVFSISGVLHLTGQGKKRWREYRLAENFESNLLTDNEEHYESLKSSLCPPKEGSFSWIFATLRAIFYVQKVAPLEKIQSDISFVVASKEGVVSNISIYNFVKKLQMQSQERTIRMHLFQGKHELFFEKPEKADRLFKLVNSWIKKTTTGSL